MLNLLRRYPKVFRISLLLGGPLAIAQRYVLGTVQGIFVCSLLLYWYRMEFGEPPPMTPGQLAIWLSELSPEAVASLASALITVVGFMIAFRTASLNWKEQTKLTLRIAAADEIESFYNEVARLISSANLFAESVVREVKRLRATPWPARDYGMMKVLMEDTEKFRATREKLVALSIDAYRISSKHEPFIRPVGGTIEALQDCEAALSDITDKIWITVPKVSMESPNPEEFASQIDLAKWTEFVDCCEDHFHRINGLTGGVRGVLLAPFADLTAGVWVGLMQRSAKLREYVEAIGPAGRGR